MGCVSHIHSTNRNAYPLRGFQGSSQTRLGLGALYNMYVYDFVKAIREGMPLITIAATVMIITIIVIRITTVTILLVIGTKIIT